MMRWRDEKGNGRRSNPNSSEALRDCIFSDTTASKSIKKNFWEELIAYFPFIRHGPRVAGGDS
jgi:hypothetical protein